MLGQALGPRERVLQRDLLGVFVLSRVVGAVQVILEIRVEIDFVEGIALLLGRCLRRFGLGRRRFHPGFLCRRGLGLGFGRRLGRRRLLFLFEQRVLDDFLRENVLKLELRHLQQLDRLLQRRRHDQPLGESEVEFLF